MNWENYLALAGSNPMVKKCLEVHVGPLNPKSTLRKWVQQKLNFAKVLSWDSLNMDAVDVRTSHANVRHTIYYHIENGDPSPGHRARYIDSERTGPITIGQSLKDIVEEYQLYWAKQGNCPIVFDAIVRKSLRWRNAGRWRDEVISEAVSIWLPPDGFHP
ncbi:MAG: hypothetical protein JWN75_383 [Candidatus Saccharibacteria bacterium]|nr:hypothetical protein [Candidatus Saccharibacteria bacterium]